MGSVKLNRDLLSRDMHSRRHVCAAKPGALMVVHMGRLAAKLETQDQFQFALSSWEGIGT